MLTRSLKIKLYPNAGKAEDLRYTVLRASQYLQDATNRMFMRPRFAMSSAGKGKLYNDAMYKAQHIISSLRSAARITGSKTNVPEIKFKWCPATIDWSKESTFDFWISVSSQWNSKRISIPAKSHFRLNRFLSDGWKMSQGCEVREEDGHYSAIVFLKKEAPAIEQRPVAIGVDVGIRNAVARSDSYLGPNLSRLIRRYKVADASRRRQGKPKKRIRTPLKQILDREVTRLLNVSVRRGTSISAENPKRLANLGTGRLQGWARSYFGNRLRDRAKEVGVYVSWVNPAYTSQTCSSCGVTDKRSREGIAFNCVSCGNRLNADINAAINISRKGTGLRPVCITSTREAEESVALLPSTRTKGEEKEEGENHGTV